jgi:hypothetical protein
MVDCILMADRRRLPLTEPLIDADPHRLARSGSDLVARVGRSPEVASSPIPSDCITLSWVQSDVYE